MGELKVYEGHFTGRASGRVTNLYPSCKMAYGDVRPYAATGLGSARRSGACNRRNVVVDRCSVFDGEVRELIVLVAPNGDCSRIARADPFELAIDGAGALTAWKRRAQDCGYPSDVRRARRERRVDLAEKVV